MIDGYSSFGEFEIWQAFAQPLAGVDCENIPSGILQINTPLK
ncbi:MAG: hypothetical protein M2R45_04346 [Verrucomicrobia subdivision 3 bacterium]|nr:hypothetical protein [Limisphaerales bacterium]MCS1416050.1 hypothetical protein [Limisphaerales bacterium]